MMWLLRVLSHECASVVHDECKDLFMSLLHLVRAYNPKHFRQYVLRLMALLTGKVILHGYQEKINE